MPREPMKHSMKRISAEVTHNKSDFQFLCLSFHSVMKMYCMFYYITREAIVSLTLVQIFSSFHEEVLWHFYGDQYSVDVYRTWNGSFCFISLLSHRGGLHWMVVGHCQLESVVAVPLSRCEAVNRICKEQLAERHLCNSFPPSLGHKSSG